MGAETRNLIDYVVIAVGAAIIAFLGALIPDLMDPALPPINYRMAIGVGLGVFVATAGAALRPRVGSAKLAEEVDKKRKRGVSRKNMTVVDTE
jgi:hypothetical protein